MGKYIDGKITCTIEFSNLYVEDGCTSLDAIFPDGYEGEMMSENLEIENERDD
jgi:hypothetical protein